MEATPMQDSALSAALGVLEHSTDESAYLQPFVEMFPVSGASVSTIGELLGSETIVASDDVSARVDELQFDLGEGPCWDALHLGRPVLEPDIRHRPRTVWPAFSPALLEQGVGSLFAFPLIVGPLRVGAIDLYSIDAVDLDARQSRQACALADAVGRLVLRRALHAIGDEGVDVGNAFSRRLIHQATGMVIAQLCIPADDARLMIQGHAFAAGRPMMEIAQDIMDRKLSFTRGEHGIEVSA